jgi:two-component system OmpR family sensor kinase
MNAAGPSVGRSLRQRTSLRTQITVVTVALAAVTVFFVAGVSAWVLREVLFQRVDNQLIAAVDDLPAAGRPPEGRTADADHDGDYHGVAPPVEYFGQLLDAQGNVIRSLTPTSPDWAGPDLPVLDAAAVQERGGSPFTVAGTDGSSWRVIASFSTVAGSPVTVVYGIPIEQVASTVNQLVVIVVVVALVSLVGLALLARWLVGLELRPLTQMEQTAQVIAAGDLTMRVTEAPPTTEVGRLGHSFNIMLERIEQAFDAQRASERQARESEQTMRRFVADASHELRTPLTSIRGFAELYRQGAAEEGAADTMARIERSAERMGVLVDDLLLLARLDERRPIEHRAVDLAGMARDVVDEMRVLAPDHTLLLEAAPDVGPASGDPERLRRVVVNLVSNACRHTEPGTTVTVTVGTSSGGQIQLEVADDGAGMDDAIAAHAFERFYRAEASRERSTSRDGSGLGLAIVDAIVRAHDGSVSLSSSQGVGTAVTVRLPAFVDQSVGTTPTVL